MSDRRAWRFQDGLLLAALVALAIGATWSIWTELLAIGLDSEEQSHILLALPVAAWLVWVRRERLRYCRPTWSLTGPVLVALGWVAAFMGLAEGHMIINHFGALIIVLGAALTILGPSFARRFFPALVALLFLMHIPGVIRRPIADTAQTITAHAAEFTLELFAVPIIRQGNVLELNDQQVLVAEACNGMRMVAALALVSFAFVFSVPMRNTVRIFILALTPAVAIIANLLRVIPTILLYGYAENSTAALFHDLSGWIMLALALAVLWAILQLLRWLEVPITPYAVAQE